MDALAEINRPISEMTREDVIACVKAAAALIPQVDPIYRFVARNPLEGLVDLPFGEAVERWHRQIDEGSNNLADLVNARLDEWMLAYFGKQANWKVEKRAGGMFATWRDYIRFDPTISRRRQEFFKSLPEDPCLALPVLAAELGVDDDEFVAYLRAQIHQRVGLGGALAWMEKKGKEKLPFVHMLAIRLCLNVAFLERSKAMPKRTAKRVWQEERWVEQADKLDLLEEEDERHVLNLFGPARAPKATPKRQSIHCIDARCSAFRELIKEVTDGDHQTFGVAGFFGVFMSLIKPASKMSVDLFPPLVDSATCVTEKSDSKELSSWRALLATGLMWQKAVKANLTATFAFPDVMGSPFLIALARMIFYPGPLRGKHKGKVAGKDVAATHLDLSVFSISSMIDMAEGCLRSIGLTEESQFAPLITVCGHKAKSVNNPFNHSLGCGACGGHSGEHNAIALCSMLNRKVVRTGLAERGIFIPDATLFVPALHNTTTDEVCLLTTEIPDTHKSVVDEIVHDFKVAGKKLRAQREAKMPGSLFPWYNRASVRAYDPANPLPEAGLNGTRYFIVGSESMAAPLKFGNAFAHTHDCRKDPDGRLLTGILMGAGKVATGINLQYLFSALCPETLGAGDKTYCNPSSIIGVKRGRKGDFMLGLTEQSVGFQNGVLLERPVRLLWIIECPLHTIDDILRENGDLANLVENGWVRLIISDPDNRHFFRITGVGASERLVERNGG